MQRRRFLTAVGATATAGCLGLVGGSDDAEYDIGMRANAYVPEEFVTTVGSTVVWKNTSSRAHTVTAYGSELPDGAVFFASGGFDSTAAARDGWTETEGRIDVGGVYEHTFTVPGTHPYFCIPHERAGMVGTVVVEE